MYPTDFFWKDLLRDKGFTVGRLDSRYKGIDRQDAGENPDYNAELTSWLHAFTPAMNIYLRNELNYKTDLKYNMFGRYGHGTIKITIPAKTCARQLRKIHICTC